MSVAEADPAGSLTGNTPVNFLVVWVIYILFYLLSKEEGVGALDLGGAVGAYAVEVLFPPITGLRACAGDSRSVASYLVILSL